MIALSVPSVIGRLGKNKTKLREIPLLNPPGVPADLKSAVKKVRPINTWGFVIPPIKGKAYSFAADCKSAEPK